MTNADIAFLATGVLAVVGGLLAITSRRVVHAALCLILVVVYVGAVVVLVLFALMLTRAPIGPDQAHRVGVWRHLGSYAAGLATTALLLAVLAPLAGTAPVDRVEVDSSAMAADLFGTWVWPFEALSVLLLAALVGGLAVARGVRRS